MGLFGGKKGAAIGAITGGAGAAIYTYKIRIKSKALVQGDDFENKIMEIKFVDVDNV